MIAADPFFPAQAAGFPFASVCAQSLSKQVAAVADNFDMIAQAVEKLKLDTETPAAGTRPKGLGMVSCVGTEYVAFKSPLPLDNKVGQRMHSSCTSVTRTNAMLHHTAYSMGSHAKTFFGISASAPCLVAQILHSCMFD